MIAPVCRARARACALIVLTLVLVSCGKKGPPLAPLILLPDAPADVAAVRRGQAIDLTFRVPAANTDRTTPADLTHVDIYASTVPGPVTAGEVLARGSRIARVTVNPPLDPDEPKPEQPPAGTNQGDVVTTHDSLASGSDATAYRAYVAVGYNGRGRRGALSQRISVPLVALPTAPPALTIGYDEKAIQLSWKAVPAADDEAPYQYNVYAAADGRSLSTAPLADPAFTDSNIEWDTERCYVVRAVRVVETVRLESDESAPACVTPRDTFPPARPAGLIGVGSEAAISLIWTPNSEPDLAGYIVLRSIEPATTPSPLSDTPMVESNFRDSVPAGARVSYSIQAVDRKGNRSEPSTPITETAR